MYSDKHFSSLIDLKANLIEIRISIEEYLSLSRNKKLKFSSPLYIACIKSSLEIIQYILDEIYLPSKKDINNMFPSNGYNILFEVFMYNYDCYNEKIAVMKLLLSYDFALGMTKDRYLIGYFDGAIDTHTFTIYQMAVKRYKIDHRRIDILKLLLDKNIENVNIPDNCGYTALFSAYELRHSEIVDLLILYPEVVSCSVNRINKYGLNLFTNIILTSHYLDDYGFELIKKLLKYSIIYKFNLKLNKILQEKIYITFNDVHSKWFTINPNIIKYLICNGWRFNKKGLPNNIINNHLCYDIIVESINNQQVIKKWKTEYCIYDNVKIFLLVVCLTDEYFLLSEENFLSKIISFFTPSNYSNMRSFLKISSRLPQELQMKICNIAYNDSPTKFISNDIVEQQLKMYSTILFDDNTPYIY